MSSRIKTLSKQLGLFDDGPTWLLVPAIYGSFLLLTYYHPVLPGGLIVLCGGVCIAWYGSLQHEVIHGHPSRSRRLNEMLVAPNLTLWLPFGVYRDDHLRHHRDVFLTDPADDPESFYCSGACWARYGRLRRTLLWAHNTLAGRLLLGPPLTLWRFYVVESRRVAAADRAVRARHRRAWRRHALGCAPVLWWLIAVCDIPLWLYIVSFVYPGMALTLLRSFAEHRADPHVARRTLIVETGPLLSLLFLNNNLHALHHAEPTLAWHRLPRRYRERRAALLAANGDYRFDGYRRLAGRFLLYPKETPWHPAQRPPASIEQRVLERVAG